MKIAFRHTPDQTVTHRLTAAYIRWKLKTDYPHAGIVLGDKMLHCTLALGLHESLFDPKDWFIIEAPHIDDAKVLADFKRWKGAKYDWFSLLAFALPAVFRKSDWLYCYEWVWLVLTDEKPNVKITPEKILAYLQVRNA